MTVVLLVGAGGYIASSRLLADWAHLSPFTYLDIPKIINGEVSTLANNPCINLLTGVLVLAASTLVVLVIGYVWLGRKNRKDNV